MLAVPAERSRVGPGFDDQIGGLPKALAGIGRVDVVGIVLRAAADHKAGVKPAPKHVVQHGELFGDLERHLVQGQAVAQHHHSGGLDPLGQGGGNQIGRGHDAVGILVVFVDDHPVKADVVGIGQLVDVLVVHLRTSLGVKQPV